MSTGNGTLGGRQPDPPSPAGGGRYQDICRILESVKNRNQKNSGEKFEVTVKDLQAIGVSGKWLEIAERVGVDTWMQIWEILDRENIDRPRPMRDRIRIWIPSYSKLIKFARNCYIKNLTDQGLPPQAIHQELKRKNIEPVSVERIQYIQLQIKGGNSE